MFSTDDNAANALWNAPGEVDLRAVEILRAAPAIFRSFRFGLTRASRIPTNGLEQSSAAQCQHVRAVSPARVAGTLGNVEPQALSQIRETIAVIIDLP